MEAEGKMFRIYLEQTCGVKYLQHRRNVHLRAFNKVLLDIY